MRIFVAAALTAFSLTFTPPNVLASHDGGCPEIIQAYFGERSHQACRVAYCESTWNPNALSSNKYYVGYFQIGLNHGWGASFDPETNTAYAYELSNGGWNWSQWSCKP